MQANTSGSPSTSMEIRWHFLPTSIRQSIPSGITASITGRQNRTLPSCCLDTAHAFVPQGWMISEHDTLYFSENGNRLFLESAPTPQLPDTTLLEEEIVHVEIWNYKDPRLYTQQNIEVKQDQKKAYRCWYDTGNHGFVQLANEEMPEVINADEGNADFAIGLANEKYQQLISWEGSPLRNDVFQIELATGKSGKNYGKSQKLPVQSFPERKVFLLD
jgi:hypothetical protein